MRPVLLIAVLLLCSLQFVRSGKGGGNLRRNRRTLFGDDIPKHRPLSGNYFAPYIGFPHPSSRSGETDMDRSEEKEKSTAIDSESAASTISSATAKLGVASKSPEKSIKSEKHAHHKVHKYLATPSTFTNTHTYFYTGADRALLLEYPTTYEAYKSPILASKHLPHRRTPHQFHKTAFHQHKSQPQPHPQPTQLAPQPAENHPVVKNDESDDGPKIHLDFVTEPKVILTNRQSHVMNAPHHIKEGSKMVGKFVRRMFTRLTSSSTRSKNNRNGSFSQHQQPSHHQHHQRQQQQLSGNDQGPIVKLMQSKSSHQAENNMKNRMAPIGLKLIMSEK